MEFWIKAAQLILSLSLLIVLHEFGHYLPARWFGTRVEKFYLFFDYKFSLFKKKIKDTEWGIGWIPLGGYVKISGMIDESMDKEQMAKEPQPWEFRTKPTWQRLIIMIGGITVNLIVGILIYAMVVFVWGKEYIPVGALDDGMYVHEEFKQYGFEDGDNILLVEGVAPMDVTDVNTMIFLRDAREITVKHQSGEKETITLPEDIDYEMFKANAIGAFMPRVRPEIGEILEESPALDFDLEQGDLITSLNGDTIIFWDQFSKEIKTHKSEKVELGIIRNNQRMVVNIETDTAGYVGIGSQKGSILLADELDTMKYSFFESFSEGWSLGMWTLSDYASQMKFLFTSKGASSMGGFGAFGNLFASEWDWHVFWLRTALISLILAFMNFLPIPALDGGHIVFLLYEMISGRKPNEKVLEYAQIVGFILLLGLVLYANGNDIYRAFFGG